MKKFLFILLSTLFITSELAFAACTVDVPVRKDVFPLQGGNITVGNDTPVGAIIYRQTIHSYKDYDNAPHMACSGLLSPPFLEKQYIYFTNAPMPLSSWQGGGWAGKIYATNIPGVGAVITNKNENTAYDFSSQLYYTRTTPKLENVQMWGDTKLILIKTGNISPGVLSGFSLPTVQYQDTYYDAKNTKIIDFKPYQFSFGGSLNVVAGTCKTKDYTVELGSWDVSTLIKSGYSEWKNADLLLEDCPTFHGLVSGVTTDNITSVNSGLTKQMNTFGMILRAVSGVIDSSQGIMNIESASNAASGIGIQIALGNDSGSVKPVTFDSETKIDAPKDGRKTIIIPLKARYIKTSDTVTPGIATGYAVFTINYY